MLVSFGIHIVQNAHFLQNLGKARIVNHTLFVSKRPVYRIYTVSQSPKFLLQCPPRTTHAGMGGLPEFSQLTTVHSPESRAFATQGLFN